MTPEERAALIATMYEADDEPETLDGEEDLLAELETDRPPPPAAMTKAWLDHQAEQGKVRFESDGKFVTLTVDGGKKVVVPSGAYVKKLEDRLNENDRAMLRVKALMKAMRTLVNRHEGDLNDVWRELDRKMNMRDL